MGNLPQNPEVHKTSWTNGRTRLNHTNLTAGINSNLDALKLTVEGIITALGGAGVPVYTKSEIIDELALKADETEVSAALDLKADKTEVDAALALKADKSTTYTKNEVDTALDLKADKIDTYTKGQIDAKIAALDTLEIRVVQTLPPTGESKIIYFVPRSDSDPGDVYDEYVWVVVSGTGSYEKIGNTDIDLSDYATKEYVTNALAGYYTQTQVNAALALKADKSSLTNVVYFEADAA